MVRRVRGLVSAAAAGMLMGTTGCGWILGLDEFTDLPPGGCSAVEQCPEGEHGTPTCEEGVCRLRCEEGFADCDEEIGCETATAEDKQNCGGCGVACSAFCVAGMCNNPVHVTIGYDHACALLNDRSVWCWGSNEHGQLGDGTTNDRSVPALVPLPASAIQVDASGSRKTCALLEDRTIWCWGDNRWGQLAIGDTSEMLASPVILPLADIQQISVGTGHACALDRSNRLRCWGNNGSKQVGDGSSTFEVPSPIPVATSIAQVSAGGFHTCAVQLDGMFACWGQNGQGALGLGVPDLVVGVPTTSYLLTNVIDISCGESHTCARSAVGVFCWGSNDSGQLGLGNTTNVNTPQPLDLANVSLLAAGTKASGALVGGEVYVWGDNEYGQLGTCNAVDEPVPVRNGLSDIHKLALRSYFFSCALSGTNTLLCWGDNLHGQLGDGTNESRCTPMPVVWP